VILTEYATEVASVEEHTPIPTTSLEARLFAKVRRDSVHDHIDINQARASLFELVDATQPRAEVTVAQMRVCCRAFLRFLDRREQLIPGCAFVEEEWRGWVGSETGVLQVVRMLGPASVYKTLGGDSGEHHAPSTGISRASARLQARAQYCRVREV
jgi:hypothetical protein